MPLHPPTESQILHSYLLHPSPLPTILPYKAFISLLPTSSSRSSSGSASLQQTHRTELRHLYRDLQFQRDITVDDIRRRIEDECNRSVGLTARLARQVRHEENQHQHQEVRKSKKRKRGSADDLPSDADDEELEEEQRELHFDAAMHENQPLGGTTAALTSRHNHSTTSLLAAMDAARSDLQSEIADLEAEIEKLRAACEDTVGGLSDLRYGRFSSARGSGSATDGGVGDRIEDDVVAALEELKHKLEEAG